MDLEELDKLLTILKTHGVVEFERENLRLTLVPPNYFDESPPADGVGFRIEYEKAEFPEQ